MISIRTKYLLAQSLTILAAVLLLGGLGYRLTRDSLYGAQREHLEFVAQSVAREIATFLETRQEHLKRIATAAYYQYRDDTPPASFFARLQDGFPHLACIDGEGREELSLVLGRLSDSALAQAGLEQFKTALVRTEQAFLAPLQFDALLKEPVIWAIARIPRPDQPFAGAIAGAIPLSQIAQWLTERHGGGQSQIQLFDAGGRRLYPEPPGDASERTDLPAQDRFCAAAPVPGIGVTVLAALPQEVFLAAPNALRNQALLAGLLILGGGITAASVLANRLAGNIRKVIDHTALIAGGDLESRLVIDSGDETERLAEAFNSMTERLRQADHSREGLSTILQSIIDPLLVTDPQGRIVQFNPAVTDLLGYGGSDLAGRHIADLLCPEDPQLCDRQSDRLCQHGPLRNHETRARTRDGRSVPVLFSCAPIDPQAPDRSGVVGILKDISELKQAEQARLNALARAEAASERIGAILESVADGLLVVDHDRTLALMNHKAAEYLGVTPETVLRQPVAEAFAQPALAAHLAAALAGSGPGAPIDLAIAAGPHNPPRILQAHTARIASRSGETTGIITTLHDVTRERQLERMKSEFISTAAHELRTPLTSVMGFAELLVDTEIFGEIGAGERQEYLHEIHAKSLVLAKLINDLLDISRIEAGRPIPLEPQPGDLAQVVAGVLRHFQRHAPRHQLSLEAGLTATTACFDRDKIVQVLENLISNAIKYSPEGGPVQVRIDSQADQLQVCVEDQGIGMTAEQVEHIFDKFYRADFSEATVSGLGLGMSIVRSIILAHNGRIWVESAPGEGTRVRFTLPRNAPAGTIEFRP